jgi:hypothetical protein
MVNEIFMRGVRAQQLLNEDNTYNDLYRNIEMGFPHTTKRQHAIQTVNINNIEFTPAIPSKELTVKCEATSEGHKYNPTITFKNVDFMTPEDVPSGDDIEIETKGNGKQRVHKLQFTKTNVKVSCNCLDFYYRFAVWNGISASLDGPVPPPYIRKTNTRPPVNPRKVPGMCKHLIKLFGTLYASGLIS